jgi:hypothetical protein
MISCDRVLAAEWREAAGEGSKSKRGCLTGEVMAVMGYDAPVSWMLEIAERQIGRR